MKYCEKCGNELKEGFAFCDKCGAKISTKDSKKEDKEKEKIEEVKEKEPPKRPVPPVLPSKPPKSGKGKVVLLTIINILLFAATITFLVLWLVKPANKDCPENYSNTDNGNTEKPIDEPKNPNSKYVGKWEQNVEYKTGSTVTQRTYGLIELKDDGSFRSLFYDKDNISSTKEELEGSYSISNNKVILKYKSSGETKTTSLSIMNDKICIDAYCENYLVKDSYNNKIVIYDDDVDTSSSIKKITYSEYEDLQKNYEDAIVVVYRDGCSWCEKFEPVVEDIADVYSTPVYYYESDGKISVSGTPETIIIKNGYIVGTIEGYKDYDSVVDILDDLGVE